MLLCFYFAYDLACPYTPCRYSHKASDTPYAWDRQAVSSHPSRATITALRDTEDAYGSQTEPSSD